MAASDATFQIVIRHPLDIEFDSDEADWMDMWTTASHVTYEDESYIRTANHYIVRPLEGYEDEWEIIGMWDPEDQSITFGHYDWDEGAFVRSEPESDEDEDDSDESDGFMAYVSS